MKVLWKEVNELRQRVVELEENACSSTPHDRVTQELVDLKKYYHNEMASIFEKIEQTNVSVKTQLDAMKVTIKDVLRSQKLDVEEILRTQKHAIEESLTSLKDYVSAVRADVAKSGTDAVEKLFPSMRRFLDDLETNYKSSLTK